VFNADTTCAEAVNCARNAERRLGSSRQDEYGARAGRPRQNQPDVRRGTPERVASAPKVWLWPTCLPPPKGRLAFFCFSGVANAPPIAPTAGLFKPALSCLKAADSFFAGLDAAD